MSWRLFTSWESWRTPGIRLWFALGLFALLLAVTLVWDPASGALAVLAVLAGVACLTGAAWLAERRYRRRHPDHA